MAITKSTQNIWGRVDKRIATLELISADVSAILSKTRIKQYKTFSAADMDTIKHFAEQGLSSDRNLIPQASI